jgi:HD-like signal output (HDOD) protein
MRNLQPSSRSPQSPLKAIQMGIKEKVIDLVRDKRTQLPTLPVVLTNILKIASDECASAADLAAFISRDQAIANKVLRLANTAYYGLARSVDTIQRAIVVIGFNEIVSLAIGMGVFSAVAVNRANGCLNVNDLWLHSIACSFATKQVVNRTRSKMAADPRFHLLNRSKGEEIFLSGLLHDIGKVIFVIYFPQEYRAALEQAQAEQVPLAQTETALLGLDHAELAGLIMERWSFPATLQLPTRYHHQPMLCPEPYEPFAMVIQVADFMCHQADIGCSGSPTVQAPDDACAGLGLSADDLASMVELLKAQRPMVEQFLTAIA